MNREMSETEKEVARRFNGALDGPPPAPAIGDLVVVEWWDSHERSGWTQDDPVAEAFVCHSAGWLVGESKTAIVVAANVVREGTPQRCGDMTIPRASIKRMTKIEP